MAVNRYPMPGETSWNRHRLSTADEILIDHALRNSLAEMRAEVVECRELLEDGYDISETIGYWEDRMRRTTDLLARLLRGTPDYYPVEDEAS